MSYLPFSEAFERAEAEKKLVHSILLWGALDDQSCWGEITYARHLQRLQIQHWYPPAHCRFRANSPGDSPGKFARPGPAQRELCKQLVSGPRAGEPAGKTTYFNIQYYYVCLELIQSPALFMSLFSVYCFFSLSLNRLTSRTMRWVKRPDYTWRSTASLWRWWWHCPMEL